ncbi:MAG: T9SS type A sorting domain-containing protein [bacterium]|nr:T9SS type A sorting domain-containing protein [bacterium]
MMCAFCFICATTASARILNVEPAGGGEYATIQAAVLAAVSGDIVELADGTYEGVGNRDVSFMGKGITIRSAGYDPEACIIDCGNHGRGFAFVNGETDAASLHGVTVTNGLVHQGEMGGAVYVGEYASPRINNCIFIRNRAPIGGALMGDWYCAPLISNCRLVENDAVIGGAIASRSLSDTRIAACEIVNNLADWSGAVIFGGWSKTTDADGQVTIAPVYDAAYQQPAPPRTRAGNGTYRLMVKDSSFIANWTREYGLSGAICYMERETSWLNVVTSLFFANDTAILCRGNEQQSWISFCSFSANSGPNPEQPASCVELLGGKLALSSCVMAGNFTPPFHCTGDPDLEIECSDIHGNTDGDWIGCIAAYENVDGNFSEDPLFCNPATGNLNIAADSPCLPPNNECGYLIGCRSQGCSVPTGIATPPFNMRLSQNHPNPFNPVTEINFSLQTTAQVRLGIYDVRGRLLKMLIDDEIREAGEQSVLWHGLDADGGRVSGGVYFYRLESADQVLTRKMILLK